MDKPSLILNVNGESIAFCNRCYIIICEVTCNDIGEDCKVLTPNKSNTKAKIGDDVPSYCNKCKELLTYTKQ